MRSLMKNLRTTVTSIICCICVSENLEAETGIWTTFEFLFPGITRGSCKTLYIVVGINADLCRPRGDELKNCPGTRKL